MAQDAVPLLPTGDDYQMVADALPPGQLHRIRSTKSPLRVKGKTAAYSTLQNVENMLWTADSPLRLYIDILITTIILEYKENQCRLPCIFVSARFGRYLSLIFK